MSNPFIPICLSARLQVKNDREEIRMADIDSTMSDMDNTMADIDSTMADMDRRMADIDSTMADIDSIHIKKKKSIFETNCSKNSQSCFP